MAECCPVALLRDSGLDRVQSLDHDIAWIAEEHDLSVPEISDDSPSTNYVKYDMKYRPMFV